MPHDPADTTHRKPRQFRNTPLGKYANLLTLGITFIYCGVIYISYRRNIVPLQNDEEYLKKMYEQHMKKDSILENPLLSVNVLFEKLNWKKLTAQSTAESKDIQADQN